MEMTAYSSAYSDLWQTIIENDFIQFKEMYFVIENSHAIRKDSFTLLMLASLLGRSEFVFFILDESDDATSQCHMRNKHHMTALECAAIGLALVSSYNDQTKGNFKQVINLLLSNNSNENYAIENLQGIYESIENINHRSRRTSCFFGCFFTVDVISSQEFIHNQLMVFLNIMPGNTVLMSADEFNFSKSLEVFQIAINIIRESITSYFNKMYAEKPVARSFVEREAIPNSICHSPAFLLW